MCTQAAFESFLPSPSTIAMTAATPVTLRLALGRHTPRAICETSSLLPPSTSTSFLLCRSKSQSENRIVRRPFEYHPLLCFQRPQSKHEFTFRHRRQVNRVR